MAGNDPRDIERWKVNERLRQDKAQKPRQSGICNKSRYVHNFSESNNPNSFGLSNSNAIVRVYWKGRLLYTFYVPRNQKGTIWNVFEIRNGNILEINKIQ